MCTTVYIQHELCMAPATRRWAQVAELLDAAQTEHTFKAVWSTNLPWGPSPCNGVEPYPF